MTHHQSSSVSRRIHDASPTIIFHIPVSSSSTLNTPSVFILHHHRNLHSRYPQPSTFLPHHRTECQPPKSSTKPATQSRTTFAILTPSHLANPHLHHRQPSTQTATFIIPSPSSAAPPSNTITILHIPNLHPLTISSQTTLAFLLNLQPPSGNFIAANQPSPSILITKAELFSKHPQTTVLARPSTKHQTYQPPRCLSPPSPPLANPIMQ